MDVSKTGVIIGYGSYRRIVGLTDDEKARAAAGKVVLVHGRTPKGTPQLYRVKTYTTKKQTYYVPRKHHENIS